MMWKFKLLRNLRSLLWIATVLCIPLSLFALHLANKSGLPDEWREAIEAQVSDQGFHIKIDSLQYFPFRGFVASDVAVFATEARKTKLSHFKRIHLVVDYSSLAAGDLRLRKIQLRNAQVSIPVDPEAPTGRTIDLDKVSGTILTPNRQLTEIHNAKAEIAGLKVYLNARLFAGEPQMRQPEDAKKNGRRRTLIYEIIEQLKQWDIHSEQKPYLTVNVEGKLSDRDTLISDFELSIPSISRRQYTLQEVRCKGSLDGTSLKIESASAKDNRGNISAIASYDLENQLSRFKVSSEIDAHSLLNAWMKNAPKIELIIGGKQRFSLEGSIDLSKFSKPRFQFTGDLDISGLMFRGIAIDNISSWVSWNENSLYLQDLEILSEDKKATGKVLRNSKEIKINFTSTLPISHYKPLFIGQPLEKIINRFSLKENSSSKLSLDITLNPKNHRDWTAKGKGDFRNISFSDVPLNRVTTNLDLNNNQLKFSNGTVNFDYRNYSLRKDFRGKTSGIANLDELVYNRETQSIRLRGVRGKFWVAPLLRMFAPKIADNLEVYRFHQPPSITASGIIGLKKNRPTNFSVNFNSKKPINYQFLGEDLPFSSVSGKVRILTKKVIVSNLKSKLFGGDVSGKIERANGGKIKGDFKWSDIRFVELLKNYGFEQKGGGQLTGRLDFSLTGNDISTFNGKGLIALSEVELFSVPIFGPLSKLVSVVLNDRRAGFERAKSAFANFTIKNGILQTNDFSTTTTSLRFTGDGEIDFVKEDIDFVVRMNARGLLGIITLPLRPFAGLFQFHGTGSYKDPVWKRSSFTRPPKKQDAALQKSPPKAKVLR